MLSVGTVKEDGAVRAEKHGVCGENGEVGRKNELTQVSLGRF
jgi:hypothetical protein